MAIESTTHHFKELPSRRRRLWPAILIASTFLLVATPATADEGDSETCTPPCRSTYVCVDGQCVSACNPPCPEGQQCTEVGECVVADQAPATDFRTADDDETGVPKASDPDSTEASSDDQHGATSDTSHAMNTADHGTDEPPDARREHNKLVPISQPGGDSNLNLHINALGLLQVGLNPTVEFGGPNYGVSGFIRLMNTGLLSYVLDEDFRYGFGIGARGRWYSGDGGTMRGIYFGGGLEYLFGYSLWEDGIRKWEYRWRMLAPQVDGGYRWGFDNFLVGVGAGAGVGIGLSSERTIEGTRSRYTPESEFLIMLTVDLGLFL